MQVKLLRRKNSLVVRFKGELDHHTSRLFREQVERELGKNEVRNLVLNLKELSFMDSSGIGAILGRYRKVEGKGGRMAICCPNPHVKKILQIGGILKIIGLYNNEEEALASMEG